MATWNMQQYDAAVNDAQRTLDNQYRRQQAEFDQNYKRSEQQRLIDNEMNRRKVAAEQLKYDRKRQAILDQRAKQDYDLNYGARLRADELAKTQHEYQKQNLADTQRLAELTRQNQIKAQNDAALQRDYLGRTYTPYQEAILKLKANGGNINILSDTEKDAIQQEIGYMLDEEAGQQFVSDVRNATPEYMKEKGVNPDFVSLYAREQRATAAKDAEYQRKNAPAIAKQKKIDQYNTISGVMTGFFNEAVSKGKIDPKVSKSKDIVDAAANIFIAGNGTITPQQAFEQAAGIKGAQNTNGNSKTEWLEKLDSMYGGLFREADTETQEKLVKVAQEMQPEINDMLNRSGKESLAELDLNQLRILDRLWKNKVNDDDYYSPFQDEIFLRERDDLYAQKSPLIAELRELENKYGVDYKDSPLNMREQRNNALPEYEKKKRSLRNKIDTINDYIKMREKKLSARRINFKEYK